MNRLKIVLLLATSLFLFSCSSSSKSNTDEIQTSMNIPDDFWDFLDEFHADKAFQKAHIQWPLQGIPTMMDSSFVDLNYRWLEDEWVMHHDFDETNEEFEQIYSMFGDDVIIEQTLHINGSIGMERRFSKREDTWNLIYYAGMNFIKK